ncbi:DUF1080 domain-containing protein [Flavobacteriaceae bacterium]|nr:DUF1080 domain-containing protein [Flavobacteriaceae bacterium]MDB2314387.1 DUF1080 domain-containing protein [Flavobacteriaceae bacterium]MDC3238221.1 DUF1080 domain-containing protein [Flavobacteriaceae bacterium]
MKKILLILFVSLSVACKEAPKKKTATAEAPAAKKEWVDLFDGVSFKGWHQFNSSEMSDTWVIEDGAMVLPDGTGSGKGNNIVTDKEYTNFELSMEWKIVEGGNSGIFWGVKEGEGYKTPYQTGPEIQVLDNEGHPDSFIKPNYHQAGALYDMVQPTQNVCKPAGEWNHVLISINYNSNKGSVKLNDVEIVTFALTGPEWDALVADSKFSDWDDFAKFKTGKIGLQDHGDGVSYRNIKIREL